jgi:hypothetical protein
MFSASAVVTIGDGVMPGARPRKFCNYRFDGQHHAASWSRMRMTSRSEAAITGFLAARRAAGPFRLGEKSPARGTSFMQKINWKLIAFWAVLWWCIYSAPTEGWLSTILMSSSGTASQADNF